MDVDALRTFAAVARTSGITKAALELHTVQSNVTAKIKQLEDELGLQLFVRHSRGMTLTSAGSQLLPYANRLMALLSEARRAATDSPAPKGQLSIGSMETTAALRLPPILSSYAALCPDVDVVLQTGTSRTLIEEVVERRLEAALVAGPVDHPDLVSDELIEEELVMVTAPWLRSFDEVVAQARKSVADGENGGLKILVFRVGCSYRHHLELILSNCRAPILRRLELGTLEGILGCVAAGLGVTMLPRAAVEQARLKKDVSIHALPDSAQARVKTVFVRRKDAFVSTALSRFLQCAIQSTEKARASNRSCTTKRAKTGVA